MRFATFKQNVFYVSFIFHSLKKVLSLRNDLFVNSEWGRTLLHWEPSSFTDFTCNCAFNQWLIYFTWLIFGAVRLKSIQDSKCDRHKSVPFVKTCSCFSQHISSKQNAMKLNVQPNAPLFLQMIYWVILGLFNEAFQCYTIRILEW